MKTKLFLSIVLLICISTSSFSQDNDSGEDTHEQRKEKIKSQKIAFITTNLDLTPDEAQLFWPVYNEYNKKREDIISERMKIMKEIKSNSVTMSEKDAEIVADKFVELEVGETTLLKEYHTKFKKIIPKIKVVKLYQSEHKFKKQLLKEMKGMKGMKHRHGNGAGLGNGQ